MRLSGLAAAAIVALVLAVADAQPLRPASADVSVRVSDAPDPVEAGQKLTYTVTVTNAGADEATGVTLSVALPTTTGFLEHTAAPPTRCAGEGPTTTCDLDAIQSGASRVVTIAIKPAASGAAEVTASATSAASDPAPANNVARATTRVLPPRLRLAVVDAARVPKTPRAGEKLYIAIAVTRSDTGGRLESGRVTCPARVDGKPVPVLLRDSYPSPTCLWRVPRGTRGKVMRGEIRVAFRGRTAARRFALRIS